jgi:vacuolar-type H+-ATPase subunit D/Vma8
MFMRVKIPLSKEWSKSTVHMRMKNIMGVKLGRTE